MPEIPETASSSTGAGLWRIAVDTGGTFTDCVALSPTGDRRRVKVLSSSALRTRVRPTGDSSEFEIVGGAAGLPISLAGLRLRHRDQQSNSIEIVAWDHGRQRFRLAAPLPELDYEAPVELLSADEAPVLAARIATGTAPRDPLPPIDLRLATTRATNALLERTGAPTALVINEGLGDLLRIGDQQRPDLFTLRIVKAPPLNAAVIETCARLDAGGAELTAPDFDRIAASARALVSTGIRHAAVCLMHSDLNGAHEHAIAEVLRGCGFEHISCSSDLAAFVRILPRARTCVANAYLAPQIDSYLDRIESSLENGRLRVMTSAGGLAPRRSYQPKDSLLSGPAGGVVGALEVGRRCGASKLIAFDMGGTSTDVARLDGDVEYLFEHTVGDATILAPAIDIQSVAAGGGSICALGAAGLGVGPESAGAAPGPACYGAGGPLTISDVNLLAGILLHDRFGIPIERQASDARLSELQSELSKDSGSVLTDDQLIEGLREIANETMSDAIRTISTRRGFDPAEHTLVAFGGAGGQHACAIADRLGMRRIIAPADAGLLSAVGLEGTVLERFADRQLLADVNDVQNRLSDLLDALQTEASRALAEDGADTKSISVRRRIATMRVRGQASTLAIEIERESNLLEAFSSRYEARFSHAPDRSAVEVESLRVVCAEARHVIASRPHRARTHTTSDSTPVLLEGAWINAPVIERSAMPIGEQIDGPAIIVEDHATLLIERHWSAMTNEHGDLVMTRGDAQSAGRQRHESIELELFTNALMSSAQNMGAMLERTALSTNVKERLDFSCTVLDAAGELIVNAPHMPVHLGAMGACVRTLASEIEMRPGDAVLTNHPAFGGSHLPDLTLVSPVHDERERLLGYVATRAHHAEIGGRWPGSMPAQATSLAEEGVVIAPMRLLDRGQPAWDRLRDALAGSPWPSRDADSNIADVRAMLAANARGATDLRLLAESVGVDQMRLRMARILERSERRLRTVLACMDDGVRTAEERLDDGALITVTVTISGETVSIDFSGSSPKHAHGFNAPESVVRSAVLYVLRLLINEPLPLNEGIMRAVEVRVPPGMLNPDFNDDPTTCPPVAAGNVETSQRVVDALLKAFGLAACSQGTMNNLSFGDDDYGYYETICGGAGAGPGFPGADAVHTHMTNTRITDPELLERRYPVRLRRFEIRRGSGGDGAFRGGDGVIREIEFLAPAQLSLLSQHRVEKPYGGDGGLHGASGTQRVIRANESNEMLSGVDSTSMAPGDRFIIETPGGGAWGAPTD